MFLLFYASASHHIAFDEDSQFDHLQTFAILVCEFDQGNRTDGGSL